MQNKITRTAMDKQGSEELLRQNVFSSIHMSSAIKCNQVSVSYPACSLCCGGATNTVSGTASKKTARKQAVFQITLYANSSESFVVWGKKVDEPKGMLWLRSCSIRRGSDNEGNMPIEMLTKGCRGRCSHTLRFSSRIVAEEWYKLLKQESRKITPMEFDDPFSSDSGGEDEDSPLDRILSDTTSLDAIDGGEQFLYQVPSSRRSSSPAIKPLTRTKSSENNFLSTSLPPLKNKSPFRLPFTTSHNTSRKISLPVYTTSQHHQQNTINQILLLEPPNTSDLERWSWPVQVSN